MSFSRALAEFRQSLKNERPCRFLQMFFFKRRSKVKRGEIQLAATDLEVGIRGIHTANVEETGGLTVLAKKLYEIVRELPDEMIQLASTANSYLSIECGRSNFTLAGTAAEEYPTLPNFDAKKTVPIQTAVLGSMIERTLYAASMDETRYNLNGVYLEVLEETGRIRMVATDGHRLSLIDRTPGEDVSALGGGVIIPRKGLSELKRLVDEDEIEEIELGFEANHGLARRGRVTLSMRLIEGEFPNYDQVIPKELKRRIALPCDTLIQALRRVVAALIGALSCGQTGDIRGKSGYFLQQPGSRRCPRGYRHRFFRGDSLHRLQRPVPPRCPWLHARKGNLPGTSGRTVPGQNPSHG